MSSIDRNLDNLSSWRLFLKVCRMGSFAAAAQSTGLSASALSRRITSLERALSTPLFERSGSEIKPTATALRLADQLPGALQLFDASLASVLNPIMPGTEKLRIALPCCLAEHLFAPWMEAFQRARPHLQVELHIEDRAVEPEKLDCDLSVQCGPKSIGSERTERIGYFDRIMVASPDYLKKHGTPKTIEDLSKHRFFFYNGGMAEMLWLWKDNEPHRVPIQHAAVCATTTGPLMELARSGKGIILSTAVFMCADDLHAGRLVRVLPEYREAAKAVNIMRRVPVGERTTVDEAVEFIRSQWGKHEGLRRDDRQRTKR